MLIRAGIVTTAYNTASGETKIKVNANGIILRFPYFGIMAGLEPEDRSVIGVHQACAEKLRTKLGWGERLTQGASLPDGSYVWLHTDQEEG